MTLWYKAWLESRVRVLVGGLLLSAIVTAMLFNMGSQVRRIGLDSDFWYRIVGGTVFGGPGSIAYVLVALLLGLGGVQREHVVGTAAFTLALPVSRMQHEASRAFVGFLEVAALAWIPVVLVLTLSSRLTPYTYPLAPALRVAALYTVCGAVWFASAFLWSTVMSAEHSATVVCLLTPIAYHTLVNYTGLRQFRSADLLRVMTGREMPYMDWQTGLINGPLPWMTLVILGAVAITLFTAVARVIKRQSF
jgi:ABC-type transport system involved in multi-copper enzyme maturation permease subunit